MISILLLLAAHGNAIPACGADPVRYEQASELPEGVLQAFGAPLADKGEPFQSTDIIDRPRRPIYRFITAERCGDQLYINYEHGGYGYGEDTALLSLDRSGWHRTNELTYHQRR